MFQQFCEMFVGTFFILISPGHETNLYPKSQVERDLHQTWPTCTTSVKKWQNHMMYSQTFLSFKHFFSLSDLIACLLIQGALIYGTFLLKIDPKK